MIIILEKTLKLSSKVEYACFLQPNLSALRDIQSKSASQNYYYKITRKFYFYRAWGKWKGLTSQVPTSCPEGPYLSLSSGKFMQGDFTFVPGDKYKNTHSNMG